MIDNPDSPNPNAWLLIGDQDFGFAKISLDDPKIAFFPQICFFFQQAAEKYLKAYIVVHNLEFRKIHELPTLLQICQKEDPIFDELKQDCDFLTEFYIEPRYPVTLPFSQITREMAKKAEESAKRIGNFVKEKLNVKI